MRQLTAKQKKLLKEQFEKNNARSVDDLTAEVYNAIDSINPCEIFWQNTERFLSDLSFEKAREEDPFGYIKRLGISNTKLPLDK